MASDDYMWSPIIESDMKYIIPYPGSPRCFVMLMLKSLVIKW